MESIKYSDLVIDDGAIQKLIGELGTLRQTYERDVQAIVAACQQMKAAINGLGSGSGGGAGKALAQQMSEIDRLKAKYDELNDRYVTGNREIEKYKARIAELQQIMKAEAKAQLENSQNARQAEESYNRLAALYTRLKIELNKYSQEEISNNKVLLDKQKQAEATMEKMKALQAATGRHTLDVGNYSKALNGLGLATQQIVREVPSLAMSFNQFFLAISNNLPIFTDAFKRVKEEMGSTKTALMQTLKSVFSWQTALIAGVTLLAAYGDEIIDFTKKMLGLAKGVDVARQSLQKYRESMQSVAGDMGESAGEINALVDAVAEGNMTSKQEADVLNYVNEKYGAYIERLGLTINSTQALVENKNMLVEALMREAQARGVLNEITEISGQIAEREASVERLKLTDALSEAQAGEDRLVKAIGGADENLGNVENLRRLGVAGLNLDTATKNLEAFDEETKVLYATLDRLMALIPSLDLSGLFGEGEKGKGKGLELPEVFLKVDIDLDDVEEKIENEQLDLEIEPILQHDKIRRSVLDAQYEVEKSGLKIQYFGNPEELQRQLREAEIAYKEKILDQWKKEGFELTYEFQNLQNEVILLRMEAEKEGKVTWFEKLQKKLEDKFGKKGLNKIMKAVEQTAGYIMEQFQSIAQARVELANTMVEQSERELETAKSTLDQEIEARNNGYANNVALAQQEYLEKQRINEQALAEQQAATEAQERLNTVQQMVSLITASASIFSSLSTIPFGVGIPIAIGLIATMFAAFAAAKVQAAQLTAQTYGQGGTELLSGGSHQSGNDIPLGTMPDGRERRAEGGEYLAIINKRSSRKYGSLVPAVVDALNAGVFEQKYGNAFRGDGGLEISVDGSTDAIERFHDDMKKAMGRSTETRLADGTRVVTYGHTRKIIRS